MPQKINDKQAKFTELAANTEVRIGEFGGQPMYEKILVGTMNVVAGSVNVPHGITGLQTMLSLTAAVSLNGTQDFFSIPHIEPTQRMNMVYNNTNIRFEPSFSWGNNRPYRIYLRYTRS